MDKAIKTELLKTLQHFKDLNDDDFRLLVQIVEEHESTIIERMMEIHYKYLQSDYPHGLDDMIIDLMTIDLLNEENNPLYDPEHKKWSDMHKCDTLLHHTIEWYMRVNVLRKRSIKVGI
jgi:hypothetical protein